jgi:phosphatidylserine decarboxylase
MLKPVAAYRRIHNAWPVAREGLPFIFSGSAFVVLFFSLHLPVLGVLFAFLTLFTIYFFRDPSRSAEADEKSVLTPADGRVLEVKPLPPRDPSNSVGEESLKVSVFMSLLDVHVNRIPVAGRISKVTYQPGKFLVANLDKASEQNERNTVTLETHDGYRIAFVQIAGLIARRIACWIKEGDDVEAGQRFGLIRFGSRLDIYLPGGSRITVEPGQKVRAGETIIGYLP